ncbi:carbohydrate ABC transporter membrane protein 2, CUT1 family [Pedococcus cremeus]|uniref:Carbohydrate ABC transporter membrane protein 2, CUT1 family n=1 Tax=Pedococcus cremeus TaxID=587636 RepID=A0A1H9VJM2_9MICO|nr:sugar ABC transporter permease [Pedococcus cremeus]SES21721.1 carbohydrate ABC transporter membrane protein 2, CUT1 family [Pedococcus cremeus]
MSTGVQTTVPTVTPEARRRAPKQVRRAPGGGHMWWRYVLVAIVLVWALFPVMFLISAALNPAGTLSTSSLLPTEFSLSNLHILLNDASRPYTTWYRNSLIIGIVGALAQTFIGACAAYAFSRMRFTGRRPGLLALLLLQLFPAFLAFVALYITFAAIGDVVPTLGLNSVWGLLLVYMGGAMGANVWLLKGYFDTVPRELDEAAKVDGASHARIFFTMTLRLVMPILVTVFMLGFVGLYSEFILASIFLRDVDSQTLSVGLYSMTVGNERNRLFGQFATGALLASLPVVVLYLGAQRYLVGGLTQGSVK